jgi:hypothetical protein
VTARIARSANRWPADLLSRWWCLHTPERAFGYRVIGPGFVIEMGSVDPAAQHLHTVYHDLGNVLGRVSA